MVSVTLPTWLRKTAFVVLLFYGWLTLLAGPASLFVHRRNLDYREMLIGAIMVLTGIGTVMRLRVAAMLLALLLASSGAKAIYDIAHGLPLTSSGQLSSIAIICNLIFVFLPIPLTVISWKRLK